MIHRSRPPETAVPDVTLTEHVLGGAAGDDRAALVAADGSGQIPYAELVVAVEAVAGGLAALGVRAGRRRRPGRPQPAPVRRRGARDRRGRRG